MFKLATLLSCCLLSLTVFAEEEATELPAITVSGQKSTAPSFNREAVSKTELHPPELPERGMNRLQDLGKSVPNFNITDQSLGSFRQIFNLRGLVNTAIYGAPATVFYLDDVAYNTTMTNMGLLFDIDNVAVYRSPQPGLFGKNAYAGAVDIHSRQPDNELKGGLSFEVGTYNRYQVTAKSSGALINDKLFFSLGGVYERHSGFLSNTFLNNHPDRMENFSGRAAFIWKPTDNWDVRLTLNKENFDYGNGRFVRLAEPKSFETKAGLQEELKQNSDSQALRIAYQNDDFKILSVSSRRFWTMSPLRVDLDLNPPEIASRELQTQNETWTQEFRIAPKTVGDWNWQVGGFYANTHYNELDNISFPGSHTLYPNQIKTDDYAVFGHLAYQGIQNLNLYADLRVEYVESNMAGQMEYLEPVQSPVVEKRHYTTVFASPTWGFDYHFSPYTLVYSSIGLGFKPGGLTYAATDPRAVQFEREKLWHNNLGIKTDWFKHRLKTNLSAFYYQMKNYQVENFDANGLYRVFNAQQAYSYGFELENRAELFENLYLESNVGYTHSRFDRYRDVLTGADYSGNPVPFVPEFTASTALQYKHPQGYFGRFEWLWKGKTYFDENRSDVLSQRDYSVLNLRIGYEKNEYSGYLFVNNLTNSYYYTTKLGQRGAPGDPRMLGIRLGVKW